MVSVHVCTDSKRLLYVLEYKPGWLTYTINTYLPTLLTTKQPFKQPTK